MKMLLRAFAIAIVLLPIWSTALAEVDDREIAYLLDWVRDSGCDFVRNGSTHSSADAADHLAMKYRRGRRYVNSTERFIERIATGSSLSGRPYTVRCSGTREQTSASWLTAALSAYRQS